MASDNGNVFSHNLELKVRNRGVARIGVSLAAQKPFVRLSWLLAVGAMLGLRGLQLRPANVCLQRHL